jgi:hypothetical protein
MLRHHIPACKPVHACKAASDLTWCEEVLFSHPTLVVQDTRMQVKQNTTLHTLLVTPRAAARKLYKQAGTLPAPLSGVAAQ